MFEIAMIHCLGIEYIVAEFEDREEAEQYVRAQEYNDDIAYEVRDELGRVLFMYPTIEDLV